MYLCQKFVLFDIFEFLLIYVVVYTVQFCKTSQKDFEITIMGWLRFAKQEVEEDNTIKLFDRFHMKYFFNKRKL